MWSSRFRGKQDRLAEDRGANDWSRLLWKTLQFPLLINELAIKEIRLLFPLKVNELSLKGIELSLKEIELSLKQKRILKILQVDNLFEKY